MLDFTLHIKLESSYFIPLSFFCTKNTILFSAAWWLQHFLSSYLVWRHQSCFFPFLLSKSTTNFVKIVFYSCLLFNFCLLLGISIFTELFWKSPKYSACNTFIHISEHPPFYHQVYFQNISLVMSFKCHPHLPKKT